MKYRLDNSEVVSTYNQWFIKLRFYAFSSLLLFLLIAQILPIVFTTFQIVSLCAVSLLIIIYNTAFYLFYNKSISIDQHKFALIQIGFDLIALFSITYLTGGITSPFIFLFIFHIIISSLLFPARIIYSIVGILISLITIFTLLEYYNFIPHQVVVGLMVLGEFHDSLNLWSTITVLFLSFIISGLLTSKIASDLYTREEQLKNALNEIEQNEVIKQKYIAGVIHELKSPIAAVSSMLGLVTAGYSGNVSEEALDKITRSEERLRQAIETINKVLRISQFKLNNEINNDSVDIESIVKKVVDDNKEICVRKEIEVNWEISKNYGSKILGDSLLIEMAVSNIFGNAIKYNAKKGRILIELSSNDKKSIIKISDTGIGIPKNELENITKDYYRASNARSSGIEGTGTGLNFVKSIIEAHKGKIKIKSPSTIGNSTNKGTSVIIALPR